MGATNSLGLTWPELTELADGPDAFSDLANGVEDYFYDRILPSGVRRYPGYHWGSGTEYPTVGILPGDGFYHQTLQCMMRWSGGVWRQAQLTELTTVAQRSQLPATLLHVGFRVYVSAVQTFYWWSGGSWIKGPGPAIPLIDSLNGGTGVLARGTVGGITATDFTTDVGGSTTLYTSAMISAYQNAACFFGVEFQGSAVAQTRWHNQGFVGGPWVHVSITAEIWVPAGGRYNIRTYLNIDGGGDNVGVGHNKINLVLT